MKTNYLTRDNFGMYANNASGPGPALMGANTLLGNDVYNKDGEDLGDIKEFMVDMASGRVAYAGPQVRRDAGPSEARAAEQRPRTNGRALSADRFMITQRRHAEGHRTERIGWLRAAVLGANDGIVSTASLVVGVAAASTSPGNILLTGVAGLVAGAMAMAAGEYVSVHSQSDTEKADLSRERAELEADPGAENRELTAIYVARGLEPGLAQQVAEQLMHHDALGAHSRDELGISAALSARPVQAALASAGSFAFGAALPLAVTAVAPAPSLIPWVSGTSIVFLALLGAVAARAGGAGMLVGAWRVTFWGALAMAITAGVGSLFGAVV